MDPEAVGDFRLFERQLQANQPVVAALARVRQGTRAGLDEAVAELRKLGEHPLSKSLTQDPFFMDLLSRMALVDPGSRRELVELQRDIGELSLTSGVISRTRKVDFMPDRPIRK